MHADLPPVNTKHWLENMVLRTLISAALALPYAWRVRAFGAVMWRVIAPLVGYKQRAIDNLGLIWPDMPMQKRIDIANQVSDNAGRSLIENYSSKDFMRRMAKIDPVGPGVAALFDAQAKGQPVILVSGHFGNYEAARACLVARGARIGGL